MNTTRALMYGMVLALLLAPPLSSCAQLDRSAEPVSTVNEPVGEPVSEPGNERDEARDYSCSYFYFLWGTHSENDNRFIEALDAYEKALVCDPSADYIRDKLPILLIKMGNLREATKILEEAIAADPADTGRRALLARIFIQQKAEARAIEQYRAIIARNPDDEEALLRLGVLLSQTEQYDEARSCFNRLLELDHEAYFARLYLARIGARLNETEEAQRQYDTALELNWSPDLSYEIAEFYLDTKQFDRAVEMMRTVLEKDDGDERARLTLVQALLALGREEEAIAELSLVRDNSNSPGRISIILSKLYLRLGNTGKAIDNLLAVIDTEDNAEARYLLGVIYVDSGESLKAFDVLGRIPPDREEFEDAVFLRTRILHDDDKSAEALTMLEGYLAAAETRRPVFYLLVSSLYQESDRIDRALATLAAGLSFFPDDERLLFDYGLQLEREGRLDEAISVMEKIIAQNPEHAEALNFVGYSWADTDRNLAKALDYIERAMRLKPDNGYIQDSLGWVHFKLGNLERARSELLGALSLVPDDPNIYEHLGEVYRSLGLVQEARTAYEAALEHYEDEEKKNAIQRKIDGLGKP